MATPSPPLQLQLDVFNESTYAGLREIWFRGHREADPAPNIEAIKRWFGNGLTPEEKSALDEECRLIAEPALATISPAKLALPPFTSYSDELENAASIAAPFLAEVTRARQESEEKGAKTLLSLVLLLDQMPRNLWRKQEHLPLIYNHYDRLSWTFVRSMVATGSELIEHPSISQRTYWMWFLMPLMHSEDIASHKLAEQLESRWRQMSNESSEGPAAEFADQYAGLAQQHLKTVQRFARYPHRNECLGRESTQDERKYLETADTYGVKQGAATAAKDEL